jgi:hypothetical protein
LHHGLDHKSDLLAGFFLSTCSCILVVIGERCDFSHAIDWNFIPRFPQSLK